MGILRSDIHTLMLILIVGNIISSILFYAYLYRLKRERFDNYFFTGKLLQIAAWVLIIYRGVIPYALSFRCGNSILSLGLVLEAIAIVSLTSRISRTIGWMYTVPLCLALANLWLPGLSYVLSIGIGSLPFALPFALSGYLLLRAKAHTSALQKWLGVIYSLCSLILAFRGIAFLILLPHGILHAAILQSITYYGYITIMITGSIGFILLKKELLDQDRERSIVGLQQALQQVKTLRGLIPICAACHKIRNDQGFWQQLDDFVRSHSDADFTHGICPECKAKLYPDFAKKTKAEG